jgi:hypothetical protein
MKKQLRSSHRHPRLVSERKPLRPVRVAAVREPVQVVKPLAIRDRNLVPIVHPLRVS